MLIRIKFLAFTSLAWLLPISILLGLGTEKARAVSLKPHKVVYDMSLETATHGSGVTEASGSMVYVFRENCDSWSTETNVELKIIYAEKGEVESDWSFVSWESKDGKVYRFRVMHSVGGSLIESYKGTVIRKTATDAAIAVYSVPKEMLLEIPSKTLFPTRHLIELISAGYEGRKIFKRTVFDGASAKNPYEVNAVIGNDSIEGANNSVASQELFDKVGIDRLSVRHVRMAFFPKASKKPEPEFELAVDYRGDGIARSIKQDFGQFVVALIPSKIELLKDPEC